MKKLFSVIMLAAALALSGLAAAAPADTAAKPAAGDDVVYRSAAFGFQVQYPAKWQLVEGAAETTVAFHSPLESLADKFSENVSVIVEDLASHPRLTLAGYEEIGLANLAAFMPELSVSSRRDYTLAGNPARLIEFTCRQDAYKLRVLQAMTIANGKAYVLTYTAEEANYGRYLTPAKKIIDSLAVR